jgi:hypothetical protein
MPRTGRSAPGAIRFWREAQLPESNWAAAVGYARFAREGIWCAAMLGWACAAPIQAGQSDFGAGLSLTYDSNVARVETNPRSEWTRALMVGLSYRENTADVTARVLVQLETRHFYHHTFSDDTSGFLDSAAVWTILPRRLTWSVDETYRQVLLTITAQDTPANRAKSNSLNTGPDFIFPLSSTNSAVIGGRYGRFDIENSNRDNRRYTAYARGLHALSQQTTLSLSYEAARVFFEPRAQVFPEVRREDVFGRYENRSVVNSTTIDLGTSRLTRYGGPVLEGNRLARLTFSEAFSSQSLLRLAFSDQISDSYSDLIGGIASSTAPRDPTVAAPNGAEVASGDLYRSKRGDLAYVNNDGHSVYTLQTYGRRVDFVTLDLDYHEKGAAFQWTWLYTGATRFNAAAAYAKRTFDSFDREDIDRNISAGVLYRLDRNVTITMEGGRSERESTAPSSSYVDYRVMLLLGYSSGPNYEAQSRR